MTKTKTSRSQTAAAETIPLPPLEVYRGSVNAWECDENRHMNVRFFAQRAMEGLGWLAAEMGLPRAFKPNGASTLMPTDLHVRFLREAHEGGPLSMRAGVLELRETDADLYLELLHGDQTPSASFIIRAAHVDPESGRPFAWSSLTKDRADALRCKTPAHGRPRSIDPERTPSAPKRARADELGVPVIGRCLVQADHCDAFGRMRAEFFLGRVSDAIPNLRSAWRVEAQKADEEPRRLGGAVLEYRLAPLKWPRCGDLIEIRSGVAEIAEKTHRIIHWLFDPTSGDAWCTAEAVAVTFDLDTRKVVSATAAQRKVMETNVIPGLTI